MALSKKTLDVDELTFQTMYIKANSRSQISTFTIPVIPGGDKVFKQLIYLTPQEALSTANIIVTPSTIPDILVSLNLVNSVQTNLQTSLNNTSNILINGISSIIQSTNTLSSLLNTLTFTSEYSTIISLYSNIQNQNISTLALSNNIQNNEAIIYNLSSQFVPNFSSLASTLDSFNQGPSVSAMSTYFTSYFNGLAQSIPAYSTSVGAGISTSISNDKSTLIAYQKSVESTINSLSNINISTLSTNIISSFISLTNLLISYNPSQTLSTLSTIVTSTLTSFSTLYTLNLGISGICSISTNMGIAYIQNLSTIQALTGSSGISSLNTYVTTNLSSLSQKIAQVSTNVILLNLSTAFQNELNSINYITSSVGYTYTILQQEKIIKSISTLSTSFGISLNTILNLSSLSTLVPSTYSTISSIFNTLIPFSVIESLSTNQGSNLSSISSYIVTVYPSINTASGVSSLSTAVNVSFSTLNASSYNNYNNAINGIYSLSTYLYSTTNQYASSYNLLLLQTSSFSTLLSSYNTIQSFSKSSFSSIVNIYNSISTTVNINLSSPTFSSFITNSITTSSIRINQVLYASSIGINQSTSRNFSLSMIGGAEILAPSAPVINRVMVGLSTYTASTILAYTSTSINQFSGQGNDIAYNGSLWVTVGSNINGLNSIKYTSIPNSSWSNAVYPTEPTQMNSVKWNGTYWLAGGTGVSTLLTSSDGITWSYPNSFTTLSTIHGLSWNGYNWVAVGSNSSRSTIQYTDSNAIWNNSINPFTIQGNDVTNNGHTWVAAGQGAVSLKYSYNAINWFDVGTPQLSTATKVVWNGSVFVAAGSNGNSSNIMYSYNGINWNYSQVTLPNSYISRMATSLLWDGTQWSVTGINNEMLVSYDSVNWTNLQLSTSIIYAQAYASNTTPTIQLSNFDIYSGNIPIIMNSRKRMNIIQSTIYFNDGDLTIRNVISSGINQANIGINTTYPQYALDIGMGDARKPSGANWLNASDYRVKENIIDADLQTCARLISEIPLRQFTYNKEYQNKTGVSSLPQYGFIAQEVKKVLPESVKYSKDFGFEDFHSLDTDQLFKLEFGATQYLLEQIQQMETQVSTLETILKKE